MKPILWFNFYTYLLCSFHCVFSCCENCPVPLIQGPSILYIKLSSLSKCNYIALLIFGFTCSAMKNKTFCSANKKCFACAYINKFHILCCCPLITMGVSSLSCGYIRLLKQSVYVKCAQKDGLFLPEI